MISKSTTEFFVGALIMGAIAAATTLFLTPVSGASIRKQVANGFSNINGGFGGRKTAQRKNSSVKTVKGNPSTSKPKKTTTKQRNPLSKIASHSSQTRNHYALAANHHTKHA